MRSVSWRGISRVCLLAGIAGVVSGQVRPDVKTRPAAIERPGVERGATLLPNGWRIAPAGRHLNIGDLPLAMAEDPLSSVVLGAGKMLSDFNLLRKISIE